MKVVVAGAAGTQSRGALWYLLKQKDISQIVAADIRLDKVKELVAELRDERLVAKFTDLTNTDGSAKVLKGADVVVNCAYEGYETDDTYVELELPATKAALKAGVNYVSVGGKPTPPEQLALDDEFKRKGILAIPGMGELTGVVQVTAAYAINKLDRTDSVDIKSGSRDLVPPEEHSRPIAWGPKPGEKGKTSMDSVSLGATRWRTLVDSVSYEDGKLHYAPPRGNPEVFKFREPIGRVTINQTPGAAVVSLARSFPDIKRITVKAGGDPDFGKKVDFLRDLGFFGKEPINVQGQMILPWDVLMALLEKIPPETKPADIRGETRVIVRGEEAGKQVEYTISRLRIRPDGLKDSVVPRSGLVAAMAAVMNGRGQTKGTGVLMPEQCIPPGRFLDEFASFGMDIEITKTVML